MEKYLVMVSPGNNHNKYYRMTQTGESFLAEYGRVGAAPQTKIYPMTRWSVIYEQKMRKGYVDKTHLHSVSGGRRGSTIASLYKPIDDLSVRTLVDDLLCAANKTIKTNYLNEVNDITPEMVRAATILLGQLDREMGLYQFNEKLLEIFTTIPRRMYKVEDFLAKTGSPEEYARIVERESQTLDALAGQVYTNKKAGSLSDGELKDQNILESMGLTIRPCTDEEIGQIQKHMRNSASHLARAFCVVNKEAEERMRVYMKSEGIKKPYYYFHGSRSCNFWNILAMGLDIKPNALTAGKMFGNGTYFANSAQKSIRYTDLAGQNNVHAVSGDKAFLSVFKVAYRNAMDIMRWDASYTKFTARSLGALGYDAVFAHKGISLKNDEIIVYQNCQSAPHYIIELQ